ARKAFLLSQGMLCESKNAPRSAQVAAADSTWRGFGPLQTTPGFFDFPVFTAAHSSMRTNILANKEDVADWLLQHPL
ncbi:MAG: hypothetical protein J5472_00005, partial [Clostridia bacterium]|nr:hypothetical protein [Clostridia bacterium]